MKQQDIQGIYPVDSDVIIVDKASEYLDKKGTVVRLGSAGEVILYHVKVNDVLTPITFMERQIQGVIHANAS